MPVPEHWEIHGTGAPRYQICERVPIDEGGMMRVIAECQFRSDAQRIVEALIKAEEAQADA